METRGADSGASPHAEARGRWCSEGTTGSDRMREPPCNDTGGAGKAPVSPPGSDGQLRLALQMEREQPSSQRSLASRVWSIRMCQEYPRSIRMLSSGWHPRKTVLLDDRSCLPSKHGRSGGKATKEAIATELGFVRQKRSRCR